MKKLNVQALARRSKELVGTLLPEPGSIVVSIDLSAGEPTITSEFSKDENYLYATFSGVGQRPEYRNGILMIDDVYLMVMSVSPIGKDKMLELYKRGWPAGSFSDQWVTDAEVIKKELKYERQFHKMLCLGLGYGMGPKKMCKSAYDNGYELNFKTAKEFHSVYWLLFRGIRTFADRLSAQMARDGYIVNPFGYRFVCPEVKAYNYFCQSTVSGVMHVFNAKLFAMAPWAFYISTIHDEVLVEVPLNRLEEFKKIKELCTQSLNEDLNWTVPIRTGWATGPSWYEAK